MKMDIFLFSMGIFRAMWVYQSQWSFNGNPFLDGGFKYFLTFHPYLGKISHFDQYFLNGLVQPPTSFFLGIKEAAHVAGRFEGFTGLKNRAFFGLVSQKKWPRKSPRNFFNTKNQSQRKGILQIIGPKIYRLNSVESSRSPFFFVGVSDWEVFLVSFLKFPHHDGHPPRYRCSPYSGCTFFWEQSNSLKGLLFPIGSMYGLFTCIYQFMGFFGRYQAFQSWTVVTGFSRGWVGIINQM